MNDEKFSTYVTSPMHYIFSNYEKLALLIFVGVIIYFVDYISHVNAILYGVSSFAPTASAAASAAAAAAVAKSQKNRQMNKKKNR